MNSGATAAVSGRRDRMLAWLANHRQVSSETLVTLLVNWVTSAMTWLVLGIALALPVFLYIVLINIVALSGDFDGNPRISIYLQQDVTASETEQVLGLINDHPDTHEVKLITPGEALADFQARSGFGDVLNSLERNPLPAVIELVPRNTEPYALRQRIVEIEALPFVDLVVVDLAWIERLFAFIAFGERVAWALSLILSLGVLLVVGNTIRLAIENRRTEIEVVKLVGGTDNFVRRPFLYLGFWYGLGGAITAWVLVQTCLIFLAGPVELIAQSYQDDYSLQGLSAMEGVALCLAGSTLGMLGAAFAVSKHLHTFSATMEAGG
jgi:cell division transport system permease protein